MQTLPLKVSVIVVSHNSLSYLEKLLPSLYFQTVPFEEIVIVETHPEASLLSLRERFPFTLIEPKKKMGFSEANNLGMTYLKKEYHFVLFCNPDILLPLWFLEKAIFSIQSIDSKEKGALGGFSTLLLGYNFQKQEATGLIDSAGIFQTFYGKFFDRFQGKPLSEISFQIEEVPAICGALFFGKKEALESVALFPHEIFDSSFFMYKEDIDLSLRLTKNHWKLYIDLTLHAFHARGWQERKKISKEFRLMSARNEWYIHLREKNLLGMLFSLSKIILVKLCDL